MNGRDKCKILKQIRSDIAQKNDIALTVAECTHKGDCAGTCPCCESEVAMLEKALAIRKRQGRKIVLAGISAGIVAASYTSCGPYIPIKEFGQKLFGIESLAGDIAVSTTDGDTIGVTDESTEIPPEYMGKIAPPIETTDTEDEFMYEGIIPDTAEADNETAESETADAEK